MPLPTKAIAPTATVAVVEKPTDPLNWEVPVWDSRTWVKVPEKFMELKPFTDCPGDAIDCLVSAADSDALTGHRVITGSLTRLMILKGQLEQKREQLERIVAPTQLAECNSQYFTILKAYEAIQKCVNKRPNH